MGIVAPLIVSGDELISTLAEAPAALALSVCLAEPPGGENSTCEPEVAESLPPPVTDQVMSPLPLTNTAVNSVGPWIWSVPLVPEGVIVNETPGLEPPSGAPA